MSLLGPGLQKELGAEWGVPLPEDYLFFCSRFEAYLFCGGSFLVVDDALDVRESIIGARQAVDMDLEAKHRLFHFAHPLAMPGYYSFRWSKNYEKMDVVFVWDFGDVSQFDLFGEPGDRFSCDSDFTSWLARMIATDCTPLFPGEMWPMASGKWFEDIYTYFKRLS